VDKAAHVVWEVLVWWTGLVGTVTALCAGWLGKWGALCNGYTVRWITGKLRFLNVVATLYAEWLVSVSVVTTLLAEWVVHVSVVTTLLAGWVVHRVWGGET
jgi:hypothetical protein